jgi:hypothetical protein
VVAIVVNRIIVGDALDSVGREGGVLLHQVNCIRAAGAGIALQIRQRWPAWYEAYRNDKRKLGDATLVRVQPWPAVWVGNLYAQFTVGRGSQQTAYDALRQALVTTSENLDASTIGAQVYVPFGLGSGLGGGDWSMVARIVAEVMPEALIVRLPDAQPKPYLRAR